MPHDDDLWNQYIQQEQIEPLDKQTTPDRVPSKPRVIEKLQRLVPKLDLPGLTAAPQPLDARKLDRKTDEKIRKGLFPIEAKLDLHGMKQEKAHHALCQFIESNHAHNKRFILVITGKGKTASQADHWMDTNRGVLKQRVPDWLSSPPCVHYILKTSEAQPKHGGSGALYIYLKKKK